MAMATDTDRYIAAAVRAAPESGRLELGTELRASIEEAITAHTDAGQTPRDAERTVLTEFGDPERFAARYLDQPLYLIGPKFYLEWRRLLRSLLWIVLPIATIGIALGRLISGAGTGEVIGAAVAGFTTVGLHVVFWTTLLFVILERSGVRSIRKKWSVDDLPDIREPGFRNSDFVASLVFLGSVVGAVLWDRLIGFVQVDGIGVPVLSPNVWPVWIFLPLLVVAEIAFAIALRRTGHWTTLLVVVNAILAIAATAAGIALLASGQLLHDAFFTAVAPQNPDSVLHVTSIITGILMIVIALWDIVDGVLKHQRHQRGAAPSAIT